MYNCSSAHEATLNYMGKSITFYIFITHFLDEMAVIWKTTFFNAFLSMKSFVFWFKFHWSLFLKIELKISLHWSRCWLDAKQVTSHYLNQCWPNSMTHICCITGKWVNGIYSTYILFCKGIKWSLFDKEKKWSLFDKEKKWSLFDNVNKVKNKANLRDLTAATVPVILVKLDWNRWFFSLCGLGIWWMT